NVFEAVSILNEIGGRREKGLPSLLPGINLLHGLNGEREETMEYNYQYLKKIYQAGLMLRRINIRQVVTTGNYATVNLNQYKFKEYKEKINQEINKPMLARVFPTGTIIENVLIEAHKGKLSFGRQLGTYPILIGIPGQLELNKFYTVRVIDHGYRSITALRWPFSLKRASLQELESIPGIGKKRALKIFSQQPENLKELKEILGDQFPLEKWEDFFLER
ncbi:MAG: helix-hairpin-helix domain-containing protein, partial [bacterium]